jgi:hypothetical protein
MLTINIRIIILKIQQKRLVKLRPIKEEDKLLRFKSAKILVKMEEVDQRKMILKKIRKLEDYLKISLNTNQK